MHEYNNRPSYDDGAFIHSVDYAKEAILKINVEQFDEYINEVAEEDNDYVYEQHHQHMNEMTIVEEDKESDDEDEDHDDHQ